MIMKKNFFNNPLAESLINLGVASLPVMTFGSLASLEMVANISGVICVISLVAFVLVLLFHKNENRTSKVITKIINQMLYTPYALGFSALISFRFGADWTVDFWLALLAVALILSNIFIKK